MANRRAGIPLISAVPWWGWLIVGGITWLSGRLVLGLAPAPKGAHIAVSTLFNTLGQALLFVGPVVGVLLAIISGLIRLTTRREAGDQPRSATVDTTSWNMPLLKALEWKRLEQLSAVYFRALNFRVEEAGPGPDGGVDLRLYTGANRTPGVLVQCKAWYSWTVGVKQIRELYGVMAAEGVSEGIYVTTSAFSKDAVEFAGGKNITLIDGEDLLGKLRSLPAEDQAHMLAGITSGDFTTPTCPSCGVKMVRRAAQGSDEAFWGCATFPKCRSTIQIRRDTVNV